MACSVCPEALPEGNVPSADVVEIRQLLDEMTDAWGRGDAKAYGARFCANGTFTNVFGDFHVGREEFDRRHEDVFGGIFKGVGLSMEIRKLRFPRPDVALADIVTTLAGAKVRPPGVKPGPDGTLSSALFMVLTKDAGRSGISAYHNIWRSPP